MSSIIGNKLKICLYGESHGNAIGAVVYGIPSGFEISIEKLNKFIKRRKTGQNKYVTKRKEEDNYEILSGYYNGKTTGTPFSILIRNNNQISKDYDELKYKIRPSHADYTGHVKYKGYEDNRGGGHFSGRITAALCVIGSIALQILESIGIEVYAHIKSIYDIQDRPIESVTIKEQKEVSKKKLAMFDDEKIEKVKILLDKIIEEKDSVGGVVEVIVHGVKAGIGNPMFDGVENKISQILFGIPSVKGVEFGSGFAGTKLKGSENNDEFKIENSKIITTTNNSGGINGGITNAMPIITRVAVKPTSSIGKIQNTVDIKKMQDTQLEISGRHDPAIVIRIVPVIEAAIAIAILDMILEDNNI